MMYPIKCLEEPEYTYWYMARTAMETITKCLYTLNISARDNDACINKTESGEHLYIVHRGKTYAVRNGPPVPFSINI